ncbi:sensor histidine kinase [Maridesulfovibrio bastinii]|uniref:sensor histidine kinase n=1 Tax=Maridesulfovibrio bastinii TaxID=47157 RepID=UPI0004017D88|nr:PAS domain-containing sensor histidine kinase [Maridesulfovibrio bastinii]
MKGPKGSEPYYKALYRNIILTIIIVSIVPSLLAFGMMAYQFNASYKKKTVAYLQEMVARHGQTIDTFLNERLANIRSLASSADRDLLTDDSYIAAQLNILREGYGKIFVDLGVIDSSGIQTAYSGPFRLERANYKDREWFVKAMKSKFYISDVFLGLREQPHFIISVRVAIHGKPYIIRSTIDFKAFNKVVANIRSGRTGAAFIINNAGNLQTSDEALNKNTKIRLSGAASVFFNTGISHSGVSTLTNEGYIYTIAPLKDSQWLLVYMQQEGEAFRELYRTDFMLFTLMALGCLAIVVMALLLSRRTIKHIKKADHEKEIMNSQVIEAGKLASVGELAAGIAHEINNPVAIMIEEAGWIEDILEDYDTDIKDLDEMRQALSQIKTQGRRCREITHKILSFARKTDDALKVTDINDLITQVISVIKQRSRLSNIEILTRLSSTLPKVTVSPSETQQVLLNLINNALDAMEKNGGTLSITTEKIKENLSIEVSDTGEGIPEDIKNKIFDPFFTTKQVGRGTGLGLSICYGIIKKYGGEIRVSSTLGYGTTFQVNIPLTQDSLQSR